MEIEQIKAFATQLNVPNVSETLESRLKLLQCDQTRISIAGGSNVGKSSLINSLANTHLEVSSLPTMLTTRVTYVGKGNNDSVDSDSDWLRDKQLDIWELSEQNLGNDSKLIDFGLHFVNTDICIMLLNSMSALSRTEIVQLEALDQLGIPTLVVLSKADQLVGNDYYDVEKYVEQKTSKFKFIKVLKLEEQVPVTALADLIKSEINSLLEETNPKQSSRDSLSKLFLFDAFETLTAECKKKIEASEETKAKVEKLTNEKKTKLSDSTTLWLKLQQSLSKRKNETAAKIKEVFEKKQSETIRQLSHAVDTCSDVKLYWEKELPFRLEEVMRMNSQTATQLINADVINTINWLNVEIKKSFNKSLNSLQPISCAIEPEPFVSHVDAEITDNRKMRIVARVGTAATVIAAGTMFATMGIGGIVMATGMVAGIGAEFFMNRKQNESKEKVLSLIPQMVVQAQQKLAINISDNLNTVYNDLIKNLQSYQDQWLEEANQNIEKEKNIALYNCKADSDKWYQCMQEINLLKKQIQTL